MNLTFTPISTSSTTIKVVRMALSKWKLIKHLLKTVLSVFLNKFFNMNYVINIF
jgi:hypothetical protein